MRKLFFFIFILLLPFISCTSQKLPGSELGNNEMNADELQKKYLESLLMNRNFVFNATDMFPRGEAAIRLNYDSDVQLKDSIMISYLPFIGTSYNLSPRSPDSGFDFTRQIIDYEFREKKKGFRVEVAVKNGHDHLTYTFNVTETGFSTLTVGSNQRQSISYYGTINHIK